jgi:hypothetical protein
MAVRLAADLEDLAGRAWGNEAVPEWDGKAGREWGSEAAGLARAGKADRA